MQEGVVLELMTEDGMKVAGVGWSSGEAFRQERMKTWAFLQTSLPFAAPLCLADEGRQSSLLGHAEEVGADL